MNQSQPQTLVVAVFLLYINAGFGALDILGSPSVAGKLPFVIVAYYAIRIGGGVLAGRGIAEERKWGYGLALAVAVAPFLLSFYLFKSPFAGADSITLIFEIVLVVLLLHTQSREYQRIWFK